MSRRKIDFLLLGMEDVLFFTSCMEHIAREREKGEEISLDDDDRSIDH